MKAVQVQAWGQAPTFTSSADTPVVPAVESGEFQVKVIASGLHNVIRSQSSGKHYTTARATLPYTPGSDGVGIITSPGEKNGQLVYFSSMATGGAMAEYINVRTQAVAPIKVPAGASDEQKHKAAIKVAGLTNPTMSSWMALTTRTNGLFKPSSLGQHTKKRNLTVMIVGVTSTSGRVAASLARHLGATHVVGAARRESELDLMIDTGLIDSKIVLKDNMSETRFVEFFAAPGTPHVDVVLDYVWGDVPTHLLPALPVNPKRGLGARNEKFSDEDFYSNDNEEDLQLTTYVQIGSLGGQEATIRGDMLRSKNVALKGSGPGAWSLWRFAKEAPEMIEALINVVPDIEVKERKLEDIEEAWKDKERSVFVL